MRKMVLMLLLALPTFVSKAESPTEKLTLDMEQAVRLALDKNPAIQISRLGIDFAEAGRKQARAQFGPKLQFNLSAMYFNEPPGFGAEMMDPTFIDQLRQIDDLARAQGSVVDQALSGALLGFGQSLAGLSDLFAAENYDVTATVRLAQPLSQLWAIYHTYKLAELGVDIARVAEQRSRSDLSFQVRQACLQLLAAGEGVRALNEAVATVGMHVERAGHFVDVGLIGKNDLLQAQARLAELQGKLIEARHGLRLAEARLVVLLDLPISTEIELRDPADQPAAAPPLEEELSIALSRRPEVRELELRIDQAQRGLKASWQGFIPGVSLIGQYQHNEGSLMIPPAWTVGVMVDFNVWEWGASHYAVEQARLRLAQAQTAMSQLRRGI